MQPAPPIPTKPTTNGDSVEKSSTCPDNEEDDTEEDELRRRETILNNNSRRLTQQNSLIAPTEIHVTTSEVMMADRVINTDEKLKRLDAELRTALLRKQAIVCDMFAVPHDDFQVIVDIAGQTEAPKEPTDLLLAAFAQIQSLTEVVSDHIVVNTYREVAAHTAALCDSCYRAQVAIKNDRNAAMNTTSEVSAAATVSAMEDEDGYCEIEEIRHEIMHNNLDTSRTGDGVAATAPDTSLKQESSGSQRATSSQPISPSSEVSLSLNFF